MREELIKGSSKYIQEFRDKIFVIKYGGSMLDDGTLSESVLEDIICFHHNKIKVVLVHGGGSAISRLMKEKGKEPAFVNGLRVTDEETVKIVDEALTEVNRVLVHRIRSNSVNAHSIVSKEHLVVRGKKKEGSLDGDFIGEVSSVDIEPILKVIDAGGIPVISPVGIGDDDMLYNINADIAAAEIAAALSAEKLILLTNVRGVMQDKDIEDSLISHITEDEVKELIDRNIIAGGMIPKVRAGILALDKGIRKVHIISGKMPHSLLKEVFTDEGVGTEIVKE